MKKNVLRTARFNTRPLTLSKVKNNFKFREEKNEKNLIFYLISANEENDENLCAYYDDEDCRFAYVYAYDEQGKVYVRAQKEKECPPEVYILGIVLGVIGAIVLIGLALLLLWKVLTTLHDRREFAKFEKERMMAKWDTVCIFLLFLKILDENKTNYFFLF